MCTFKAKKKSCWSFGGVVNFKCLLSFAWNSFGLPTRQHVGQRACAPAPPPLLWGTKGAVHCPGASVASGEALSLIPRLITRVFPSVLLRRLIDFPGACLLYVKRGSRCLRAYLRSYTDLLGAPSVAQGNNPRIKVELEYSGLRWRWLSSKYRFFSLCRCFIRPLLRMCR